MIRFSSGVVIVALLAFATVRPAEGRWGHHGTAASWGSYGGASYAAPIYQASPTYQAVPFTMQAPVYQGATYQFQASPALQSLPLYVLQSPPFDEAAANAGDAMEALEGVQDLIDEQIKNLGKKVIKTVTEETEEEGDCAAEKKKLEDELKAKKAELKALKQGERTLKQVRFLTTHPRWADIVEYGAMAEKKRFTDPDAYAFAMKKVQDAWAVIIADYDLSSPPAPPAS